MRRLLIGLALTAISLVLLIQLIDWNETWDALKRANPWYIALAVGFLLLSVALKTVRWRFLLPTDAGVTVFRLFRILNISYMLNNVLPARLGDVGRVAMTSRQQGIRIGHVISSLLTERASDAVMLLACFVLISPFLPVPREYVHWVVTAWWVLGGLAVLVIVIALLREHIGRVAARMPIPGALGRSDTIRQEARSFADGMRQMFTRQLVAPIWGFSALAWAAAFAVNVALLEGMNIDVPLAVAVLLSCVTNLAMLIPSSPGYIGVFHAVATLVLLPFGIGHGEALSFAIVAHLVNVVPVSLLGAGFLLFGHEASFDLRAWRKKASPADMEAVSGAASS